MAGKVSLSAPLVAGIRLPRATWTLPLNSAGAARYCSFPGVPRIAPAVIRRQTEVKTIAVWPRAGCRQYSTNPDKNFQTGIDSEIVQAEASRQPMKADNAKNSIESIESILVRSYREELVQKSGPEVQRYMPSEDPNAFLLPDNRLLPEERSWQKVFVAVPWLVFACMLSVPLLLVRTNLPWLEEKASRQRQEAESRAAASASQAKTPEFSIVSFGQMPDVLERPFPTLLLLIDPQTYASQLFLPMMRDVEAAFRRAGLKVAVTVLDMSAAPAPPMEFDAEYSRALSPHMQLIIPRASEGEAGVIDYDGGWTAASFVQKAYELAGPRYPDVPSDEIRAIQSNFKKFRELLFELYFGAEPDFALLIKPRPWWCRLLGLRRSTAELQVAERQKVEDIRNFAIGQVDFSGGLEQALVSAIEAMDGFKAGRTTLVSSS